MASALERQALEEADAEKLEETVLVLEEKLASADAQFRLIMEEINGMGLFSQAISAASEKLGFSSSKAFIEATNKIDSNLGPLARELDENDKRATRLLLIHNELDTVDEQIQQDIKELELRLSACKMERMVKEIIVDYLECASKLP
jgi:hypothetical protein